MTTKRILKTSRDVQNKVSQEKPIPVWYYWEGTPSPAVQLCIMNWRTVLGQSKYNFEINQINHKNLKNFIDRDRIPCTRQLNRSFSALKSDFVRLALLEKYGGLYMDASMIMCANPEWMIREIERGWTFQAFFNPDNMLYGNKLPVVETSMLYVSKPNHPLIKVWLNSMLDLKCNEKGRLQWLNKHIKDKNVRMQANLEYEYHMVYHALQMVFEKIQPFSKFKGVKLYNTAMHGFFTWNNSKELFTSPFLPKDVEKYPKHFLKLIKKDREELDYLLQRKKFDRNSWAGIMLLQNGSVHRSMRYVLPRKHKDFLLKCQKSPNSPDDLFKSYLDCLPCKGDSCRVGK